jgi:hypothetical protein
MEPWWQKTPLLEFAAILVGTKDHIVDLSEEASLNRHDTVEDVENAKTYLVSDEPAGTVVHQHDAVEALEAMKTQGSDSTLA